jgi:hypothetical protein
MRHVLTSLSPGRTKMPWASFSSQTNFAWGGALLERGVSVFVYHKKKTLYRIQIGIYFESIEGYHSGSTNFPQLNGLPSMPDGPY